MSCGVHEAHGSVGVGKVRGDVFDPPPVAAKLLDESLRAALVGAPRLLGVVRRPRVHQHRGAVGYQPKSHAGADRYAAAGAGHKDDALFKGSALRRSGRCLFYIRSAWWQRATRI